MPRLGRAIRGRLQTTVRGRLSPAAIAAAAAAPLDSMAA
jgi:hypothetical protein